MLLAAPVDVPLVASAILAAAILESSKASLGRAGGSMVLLAANLLSQTLLSSCRTFSSTDSSRKASLTLEMTSLMTEWYKLAADVIVKLWEFVHSVI